MGRKHRRVSLWASSGFKWVVLNETRTMFLKGHRFGSKKGKKSQYRKQRRVARQHLMKKYAR